MLFENDTNYLNMLFNLDKPSNNYDNMYNQNNEVGFLRGNMFDNEFKPYKNMTYIKPKLSTQREKDLFKIMESAFMINDYNLYLDVHPDDANILNKYKMSADKLRMLTKEYEDKYGPLCITSANYDTFKWLESPWPWDKEDGKYV